MAITVERLTAEIDVDPSKAVAGIEVFEAAVADAAKDRHATLDVNAADAELTLAALDAELDVTTRDRTIHIDVDKDRGFSELTGAIAALDQLVTAGASGLKDVEEGFDGVAKGAGDAADAVGSGSGFTGAVGKAGSAAGGFGGVLGTVGSVLSGLIAPTLIFALVTVLPGAFAAAAGAAGILLGALVPLLGLLGAIPVAIGGLGAVFGVLAAVFVPVLKGLTAYGQATKGAAAASEDLAAKQHALVSANQAVASATHSVQQAEQALSDARKNYNKAPEQAEEALRQAHFTAAQAALNEKSAILALVDAQKNLRDAQSATSASMVTTTKETDYFTGKVYEVATASKSAVSNAEDERKARLAVAQAELNVQEARDANDQAQLHLTEAEKKGIKNSDIMVAARRQLASAEYNLKQAHLQVANAEYQRAQAEKALHDATVNGTAATKAWIDAQKGLTDQGVEFVKFLHDDLFPIFGQISKAAQDGLLPGVEAGLKDMLTLVGPVTKEVGDLSQTLGDAFENYAKFWSGPKQKDQVIGLFTDLNKVIGAGLDLLTPFSRLMADITQDATPMTVNLLDDLASTLDHVATWMESAKGQKETIRFFNQAGHFAELWGDVLKPIGGIFLGISRAVEPLSTKWLKSLAGWLDDINKKVNSPKGQKTIFDYITSTLPALHVVGDIVEEIVNDLFNSSKGGTDSSFYKFLVAVRDDLLPPIEEAFKGFDASTFAADLTTNVGDLVTFLETVDWKQVGDNIHEISGDIHSIVQAGKDSKPFLKFMEALTSTALLPVTVTWRLLSDLIGSIPEELHQFERGLDRVSTGFHNVVDAVSDFNFWTQKKMDDLNAYIYNHFTVPVAHFFSHMWDDITKTTADWWKKDKEFWQGVPGWVHDHVIQPIEDGFDNFFTEWLPKHFKDAIKNLPKAAGTSLLDLVPHPSISNPFHHWSGGATQKDTPYLVGEQGPELFMPSSSGRIMPAAPTKEMMTSTKAGIDPEQLEDILRRVLAQAKPDVKIDQTFNEKIDPKHVAAELAWEIAGAS